MPRGLTLIVTRTALYCTEHMMGNRAICAEGQLPPLPPLTAGEVVEA